MVVSLKNNRSFFPLIVGLTGWLVPGAGHLLLNEKKRAAIIFVAVGLTFAAGLYVGSIGVVDPVASKPWYIAQVMNSPAVALLGHITAGGGYVVYGRVKDLGQVYTGIAGMLNLFCIVNAVYLSLTGKIAPAGE